MAFQFEIGQRYQTQSGEIVKVLGRTNTVGYECLICSDKKHRYDRSTESDDAGRVTGTAHDYSCPDNFRRNSGACLRCGKEIANMRQHGELCPKNFLGHTQLSHSLSVTDHMSLLEKEHEQAGSVQAS